MTLAEEVSRAREAARRIRDGEPLGPRSYRALRRLHTRTGGGSSAVLGAVARRLPGHAATGEEPVDEASLAALRRDGVVVLPWRLPAEVVERLVEFARQAPVGPLGVDAETCAAIAARGPLRYDDVRTDLPMALVTGPEAMRSSDLQALVVDARLLGLAQAYLRARPVAGPATLTWTTGVPMAAWTPHETRNATLYHWDFDGLSSLRVHIYLTDVDAEDAPMRYLRGSHRPSRARTRLLRAGDVGHSDPAAYLACGREAETVITGAAGTVFVSDSQGLHRGSPASGRERLFAVWALGSSPLVTPVRPRVPVTVSGTQSDPRFAAMLRGGDRALALFEAV